MHYTCRICGNSEGNRSHIAREMMLGLRDEFEYIECGECGTLQIAAVPDLSRYYPKTYYSLAASEVPDIANSLKRRLASRAIGKYFISGRGTVGRFLAGNRPWIAERFPGYLRRLPGGIDPNARILDLGCGAGELLRTLQVFGFRRLAGADAFIEKHIEYPGIRISKRELKDLDQKYDLIMLNHSFEHLADPRGSLSHLTRLLERGGTAIVRIPIVSHAWERYGVNWVQLDPPRHLFLYTEETFVKLAAKAGLYVADSYYDSTAFQFWASEQYAKGISMADAEWDNAGTETKFPQNQIEAWANEAAELNRTRRGDQACFYLRAKDR